MKLIYTTIILFVSAIVISMTFAGNKQPDNAAELGELLFFDPLLSADYSKSCASCHQPQFAFADTAQFSEGTNGTKGLRHTPSIMNLSERFEFFWDGRASSLEEQALIPIQNPDEMNLSLDDAIQRLTDDSTYFRYFQEIFQSPPNEKNLAEAIAAFERTLETGNSHFDRFIQGEEHLFSEEAKLGRQLFNDKAQCFQCHLGPDFTSDEFRNIGLYNEREYTDRGRFEITQDSSDLGRFKVPGLRNIGVTAPYMHDGSMASLAEVINFYDQPDQIISNSINRDTLMNEPLNLTEEEKIALEAYLMTFTDERFLLNVGTD